MSPGLYSQDWYRLGTNNFDLDVVDANTVVVVGQTGRIIRSDDDGATWQRQLSGTTSNLNSVHFYNRQLGVVVGESGSALRTIDAGATWSRIETGTGATLRRMTTAGENILIAVGDSGTVVRSINRGESWQRLPSITQRGLRAVDMWDASAGVAVGDSGVILRTTDGGSNWLSAAIVPSHRLNDVLYLSLDSVIAVGDRFQTILSVDGGVSWRSVVDSLRDSTGSYSRYSLRRVIQMHDGDLLAIGQVPTYGNIWRSSDLGHTWTASHDGTAESVFMPYLAVEFSDENIGYLVGYGSTIYKTENGGQSWDVKSRLLLQSEPWPDAIHQFVAAHKMFTAGHMAVALSTTSGGYFQSADSGVTWSQVSIDNRVDFRDMHFFDSANGRAVTPFRQMFTTTDGGNTWWITAQHGIPNSITKGWTGLEYHDAGLGLVYADGIEGPSLFYTVDSSQTWQRAEFEQPFFLFRDVVYADARHIIAICNTGFQSTPKFVNRVFVSVDSGATWQMAVESMRTLVDIEVIDARRWLVTMNDGGFLRTTNAGQSWDTVLIPEIKWALQTRFFNGSDGYIAAANGIWRTSDGGETWRKESLANAGYPDSLLDRPALYQIELSPDRRTLLASGPGLLLRKDLSEPIPLPTVSAPNVNWTASSLRLSVLPNPVRDAAVLRITGVKSLSGTALHIYDALGRSVADLSDELRHSSDGTTIEIELPADRLRSGSYSVRGVVGGESVQSMFVVAK